MKTLLFVLLSTLLCACQNPSIPAQSTAIPSQQQAQDNTGNLIIFYDAQTGSAPLLKAVKVSGVTLVYEYKNLNGIAIRPSSKTKIEDAITYFKKVNGVLSVEQDKLLKLQ